MNTFEKNEDKIIQAFLVLAKDAQNLSDISIPKIASRAGISYQAVYKKHYQNPKDILEGLHIITEREIENTLFSIRPEVGVSPFRLLADRLLPAIYRQRDMMTILYRASIDPVWHSLFEEKCATWLRPYISEVHSSGLSQSFLTGLATKFIIASISEWVASPDPIDCPTFQTNFYQLTTRAVGGFLRPEFLDQDRSI